MYFTLNDSIVLTMNVKIGISLLIIVFGMKIVVFLDALTIRFCFDFIYVLRSVS